jgi:hypothetical protein
MGLPQSWVIEALGTTLNAITTQTNPVLRKPDSLHFFRIVKEQPNETYG